MSDTIRKLSPTADPAYTRDDSNTSGTSIFDPVLCELVYRWFCPEGGQVVDPFAGGSVRGIVAHCLNRKYWGCDLRIEQVDANYSQADDILPDDEPIWITGDALDELEHAPPADLVFSCPPYADLERYSDDPRDLSTMEYHTFLAAYKRIIARACAKLKQDRFACFVVGDIRDKAGNYRNFPGDTVNAFREQGLELYNEAILVTCVGSLPIRITKQFEAGRKLGKTHQNVLVFVKGDGKEASLSAKPGEMP
jgi:DNA modification methylase